MTLETSSPDPLSGQAHQLLATARQKLCSTDMPHLLRIVAFLGCSCQAMAEPEAYTNLMKELGQYKGWWQTCKPTPTGTLKSSNPEINCLLEPINRLHQTID